LTQGSIASLITDSFLKEELERIALKAANSIGLRFGSVDIIVTENDEHLILEMNSGVMLYEKIKPLYKEVILKMFN
jgi:glutathione synthase/RimK-type ligase-like ATP-grasp enzyme